MAELRAFCANGGIVGIEHLKAKGKVSSLVKNATKKTKRLFQGIDIETLDNLVAMDKGKVNPIFKKLRVVGVYCLAISDIFLLPKKGTSAI